MCSVWDIDADMSSHSDLSKFIAARRVSCVIDKVSGVITKTSGAQRNDKYSLYEQVLNAGDSLLNGMSSVHAGQT